MQARTSLAVGFTFISLMVLGCTNQSAPDEPQSALPAQASFTGPASLNGPAEADDASLPGQQKSGEAEDVSQVVVRQPGNPPARPSVVRWIGPGQIPVDANVLETTPPPGPIFDQSDRAGKGVDQPIQEAEKPSVKADVPPVVTNVANRPVKIAGSAGNPVVVPSPRVLAKPATMPTNDAESVEMARADEAIREAQKSWDNAVKVASEAARNGVDAGGLQPSPVLRAPPATKPAPSAAVIEAPKSVAEPVHLLPSQLQKGVSLESVLARLPQEATPLPKIGWDAFSIPKAHQWLKEQLAGTTLQVAVDIVHVEWIRIPSAADPDESAGWVLALTTKPERFRAFGLDTFHWPATWREDVSGKMWRGGKVRIPITEDFAKQARLWRIGDTAILSGTVEDVVIEGGMTNLGQPCGRFTTIYQDVHVVAVTSRGSRP